MKVPIPAQCAQQNNGLKIVCAQRGRRIIFLNPKCRTVTRYTIDDCAPLRKSLAPCKLCDFVVLAAWRSEEHYVELKGKNVEHALLQLESSLQQLNLGQRLGVGVHRLGAQRDAVHVSATAGADKEVSARVNGVESWIGVCHRPPSASATEVTGCIYFVLLPHCRRRGQFVRHIGVVVGLLLVALPSQLQ